MSRLILALAAFFLVVDASAQWTQIDTNLSISVDYAPNLFAATESNFFGAVLEGPPYEVRMYQSSDAGASFAFQSNLGAFEGADVPTVFKYQDGVLVIGWLVNDGSGARFAVSEDGGATWTVNIAPDIPEPLTIAVSGSTIYAGSVGAVSRSTDLGATWEALHVQQIAAVNGILAEGNDVFVVSGSGVFHSPDGATTLNPSSAAAGSLLTGVWEVDGTFYAKLFLGAILSSSDNGLTWTEQSTAEPFGWVTAEPTLDGSAWVLWNSTGAFWLSTDNGATAQDISDGWPTDTIGQPCLATHLRTSNAEAYAVAFCGFGPGDIRWYRRSLSTGTAVDEGPVAVAPGAVYPNPADGMVIVPLESRVGQVVEVFDVVGRRVLRAAVDGRSEFELNVSGWTPGLYMVRTVDSGRVSHRPFLVR